MFSFGIKIKNGELIRRHLHIVYVNPFILRRETEQARRTFLMRGLVLHSMVQASGSGSPFFQALPRTTRCRRRRCPRAF